MSRGLILALLLSVFAVFAAGCTGSRLLSVGAPEVKSTDKWWSEDTGKEVGGSDFPREETIVKTEKDQAGPKSRSHTSVRSGLIADRIAADRNAWLKYYLGCDGPVPTGKDSIESPISDVLSAEPEALEASPEDIARIRKKYSAEYFNAQLKVSLLESRLESASDVRKELWGRKLDQARNELNAVEDACRREIDECVNKRAPDSAVKDEPETDLKSALTTPS